MLKTLSATKKAVLWGSAGSAILVAFYVLVLALANSPAHVLEQFILFWPWLSILIVGFGVQVGLFSFIRYKTQEKRARAGIIAAGGVSAGSMVACCAHHLVDVMAVMGISALFVLLAQYQFFFIILGVVGNLVGVIMMLEVIKTNELAEQDGPLSRVIQTDLKSWRNWTVTAGVMALALIFFWVSWGSDGLGGDGPEIASQSDDQKATAGIPNNETKSSLGMLSNSEGNVTFELTPIEVSTTKGARFEVIITTHQGDLTFDLGASAYLLDDQNKKYQAIDWKGGSGGHHLSGELVFPALNKEPEKLTVIIENAAGIDKRVFEWDME